MNEKLKRNLKLLVVLSIIGLIDSAYLLYVKYSNGSSFCDFSKTISCHIVNKSIYGEFPPASGIPIAGIGFLGYVLFFALAFVLLKGIDLSSINKLLSKNNLFKAYFVFALIGLLFSLYLTYIELFVLYTICPLCVVSLILIICIFFISWKNIYLPKEA